ncbi:MAG: hypothetical protein QXP92_01590 [Nitrososphaerota archaeon]
MNSRKVLLLLLSLLSVSMLVVAMYGGVHSQEENRVEVIFYIDTGLGGPQIINSCSRTVVVGENVSCVIDREIKFINNTKIVFRGWYKSRGDGNEELVTKDSSITVVAVEGEALQEYIAKYQVYYLIELDLGYSQIQDWKPRNGLFTLDILDMWEPAKGIRKVFSNWRGDITGKNPYIYIDKISKPIRAEAVWETQYYVEVISEYALSVKTGWFNEGQTIHVEPSNSPIYENDGETKITLEKYLVDYWTEDKRDLEVVQDSLELNVDSPLTIKAVWVKLHHVILESSHIRSVLIDEWIRDGARLTYNELEGDITWVNKTRIVFEKWVNDISQDSKDIDILVTRPLKAYATWRVYYLVSVESSEPSIAIRVNNIGWVERGSYVIINATPTERELSKGVRASFKEWVGSIISSEPVIEVRKLDQSIIIKALWVKKYLVTIDAPDEVQISRQVWVREDEEHIITAPYRVNVDNNTRLIFSSWEGCNLTKQNTCILKDVTQPLTLKANYFVEKKIRIEAVSLNEEVIEEVHFNVKHESGEVLKLMSGDTAWMKIGKWRVMNATWRTWDVSSMYEFMLTRDSGELLKITIRIFRLSFKVNDYFGFPVKDAVIIVKTADGEIVYEGRTNEDGVLDKVGPLPPLEMVAYITYGDYRVERNVSLKTSSPVYVTVPMSHTFIQIIMAMIIVVGSLSAYAIIRKIIRRRKEVPIAIPMPIELPPARTPEEEPPTLEKEVEKAPVVTLEDVVEKLRKSGEKPEEILGELAEMIETEKKKKDRRKSSTSKQSISKRGRQA